MKHLPQIIKYRTNINNNDIVKANNSLDENGLNYQKVNNDEIQENNNYNEYENIKNAKD